MSGGRDYYAWRKCCTAEELQRAAIPTKVWVVQNTPSMHQSSRRSKSHCQEIKWPPKVGTNMVTSMNDPYMLSLNSLKRGL